MIHCGQPNAYLVYNYICKMYLAPLEENWIKLLDFRLALE